MRIFYYFNEHRDEKYKAVVKAIYGNEVTFTYQRPWEIADTFEEGDILICNSVDELAGTTVGSDTAEIIKEYMDILNKGVELMFDKSTQCNSLFIKTLLSNDQDFENVLRKCIANYESQKDLAAKYAKVHAITATTNGNKLGIKKGTKLTTKKSIEMKEKIRRLSKTFDGTMSDMELVEQLGIARNSYYKYKKELKDEVKDYGILRSE